MDNELTLPDAESSSTQQYIPRTFGDVRDEFLVQNLIFAPTFYYMADYEKHEEAFLTLHIQTASPVFADPDFLFISEHLEFTNPLDFIKSEIYDEDAGIRYFSDRFVAMDYFRKGIKYLTSKGLLEADKDEERVITSGSVQDDSGQIE